MSTSLYPQKPPLRQRLEALHTGLVSAQSFAKYLDEFSTARYCKGDLAFVLECFVEHLESILADISENEEVSHE